MDGEQKRDGGELCHRDEIVREVVIELPVERSADRVRDVGLQQRVAVGRGSGHDFGSDVAARARAVVDDDLLGELLAGRLPDDAREVVGAAARRKRNHEPERPLGIGLGVGERPARSSDKHDEDQPAQLVPP
jgi:hypothetical protein